MSAITLEGMNMFNTHTVSERRAKQANISGVGEVDAVAVINRCLACYEQTEMDQKTLDYLAMTTVCLVRLAPTVEELDFFFARKSPFPDGNPVHVAQVNRVYLEYLRDSARDFVAGDMYACVETGLTRHQGLYLAKLSHSDTRNLSRHWQGLIFKFNGQRLAGLKNMHWKAALYHTGATVTYRE